MSRPWALGFKSEMIRPLKWGTLGSRTPDGSKNTSHQSFIFFLPTTPSPKKTKKPQKKPKNPKKIQKNPFIVHPGRNATPLIEV